jgi:hypothetical protein
MDRALRATVSPASDSPLRPSKVLSRHAMQFLPGNTYRMSLNAPSLARVGHIDRRVKDTWKSTLASVT